MNPAPFFSPANYVKTALLTLIFLISIYFKPAFAAPTGMPQGFSTTVVTNTNMGTTSAIEFAPDGRLFVMDLYGQIKIYKNGAWNPQPFATIAVNTGGDKGLLGGIFHKDFPSQPYFYIHYVGTDNKVHIGRYTVNGDTGSNFTVLYTASDESPFQHAGGGIDMGHDGMIYFGIGDNGYPPNSQNLSNSSGKIHRINSDGTIPTSNPYYNHATAQKTIFAHGFRNPFRLHTDRVTGKIYVGDVGFEDWEEVNLITSGKNYGWPTQEGPCSNACPYENPVYWYSHQFGNTNWNDSSIVSGPVYRGNLYPSSYVGKMFVSDFVQAFIRIVDVQTVSSNFTTFSTDNGPVGDIAEGPDGKIYYSTIFEPVIYRIDYNGGGNTNQAPTARSAANVTSGTAPLTVNFNSNGSSDPENQTLTYNWNFGDGTNSTQANPSKIYNEVGQYTVTLTVSDGVNTATAAALTIRVGALPVVTITSPTSQTTFKGGDVINYSATAKDSSGNNISNNNLKTTIRLHHSDHNHPYIGPVTGGNGQFTIPKSGELDHNIWYRVSVEATDANGLVGSAFVDVQPKKANLTINSNPAGLNIVLDGTTHPSGHKVLGVVGLTRSVNAPSTQTINGQQYEFSHWSDNGAQSHDFDFPENDTTLTAHYVPANGNGGQVSPTPTPSSTPTPDNNSGGGSSRGGKSQSSSSSRDDSDNDEDEGEVLGEETDKVFDDINEGGTFYIYIKNLKQRNIISGYRDGDFGPSDPVTRGQLAKMLIEAFDFEINNTGERFVDVDENHSLGRYIQTLRNLGISNGYEDGTFAPNNHVRRGEAAKMIVVAMKMKNISVGDVDGVENMTAAEASQAYIELLGNIIVDGENIIDDTSISHDVRLNRGQISKIIWLSMNHD